jgi:hypothetical protein
MEVYTSGNMAEPAGHILGELRLAVEYGPKEYRDANDHVGARCRVVFSFGIRGYGGRRRYVPTAGEDRWKVFEKADGQPEEAAGETSEIFDDERSLKI